MATIDQDSSWHAIDTVRSEIADLLDDLDPPRLATPSLCAAWSVRDVGAHLSLAATMPLPRMIGAAVRSGFRFDSMIRDATLTRARSLTDADVTAALRDIRGNRRLAPGTFWRDPLLDALVHAQDIARPLGATVTADPDVASAAAEWAWRRGMPFFPGRRLRGLRLVATDADWARGTGAEVHGPSIELLLLSTGRRPAEGALSGPGASRARDRGPDRRTGDHGEEPGGPAAPRQSVPTTPAASRRSVTPNVAPVP